ncbi:hypothetical protein [Hymenobacter arizonensis]|uniref:Uncharacterized protein n=1 Tax=Hymenobacter arizonensis TaxID=1227077 RepID=A0A1I6BT09_HYMAR|nr:hypothetical protein [Hymenobacter arizonensis]SFQ84024.1 hypothetical protein SAMN04515668_5065 [Hymenobacter arizonensis]
MRALILSSTLLLSLLAGPGCGPGARNDRMAVLRRSPGGQQLRLSGLRVLMAHDPLSALQRKTYRDSITFQLPATASGLIAGSSIPLAPGSYAYRGSILLQPEARKVTVQLFYDNTDDQRRDLLGWNGEYELLITNGP